jgi:nitronate monooxygenase
MTSGLLKGRGLAGLFGLDWPIVQAPMNGGITTPALVAASCEAGALGSLAAATLSPERIRSDVEAIRALTRRPFSINLFVLDEPDSFVREGEVAAMARIAAWRTRFGLPAQQAPARVCESFAAQLAAVIEAAPAVVSFHFGIPAAAQLAALRQAGCRIVGGATHVAEARAWADAGADAIVAQGGEAGGHRGTFVGGFEEGAIGTMALVPRLVDAVDVPIIAAGGIMDGRGVAAAFALGALGVQLGTAFLACDESGAHPAWKAALAEADARGTRLTRVFSGRPARGLVNTFMDALRADEQAVPGYPLQNALTAELRAAATKAGDIEVMSMWAGQAAALARPMSAAALVARLAAGFDAAVVGLAGGRTGTHV